MRPTPVTELLAQQLHREYRAAEKALRCTDVAGERPYLQHDHGGEHCHRKKYFRQRAATLAVRADAVNPTTLGDAECALAATVLIRRLSVEGRLKLIYTFEVPALVSTPAPGRLWPPCITVTSSGGSCAWRGPATKCKECEKLVEKSHQFDEGIPAWMFRGNTEYIIRTWERFTDCKIPKVKLRE